MTQQTGTVDTAAKIKDLEEENELLLLQLHQVQEELEVYFLKYKDLEAGRGDSVQPTAGANIDWVDDELPEALRTAFAGLAPGAVSRLPGIAEVVDEPVPAEIRERLLTGRRSAAVLIPILQAVPGAPLRLLLTQRTAHLRDHAGQISFPGGGLNPGENATAGALREAQEEIGLNPEYVDLFGQMPQYHTGTGFSVSPMIGFVQTPCELVPDPGEVAEIFDVPLDFVLDPRNIRQETRYYRGAWRSFLAIPWSGYYIWGATAGMLAQLSRIVRVGG